jgi:Carboxypeptidase regulatory-like domain/TonB-dependent Receptor Plug Domain
VTRIQTKWRWLPLALVALLAAAPAVYSQEETGNVYVVVGDNTSAALPGATVELSGVGAPQLQITNAQGQVRFLALSPGTYQLKATLEGFSTVEYPSVVVSVGRNTTIEANLSPAVEETITVTSESPLLDERKVAAGTSITQVELEKIPTARDPWAILNQASGVMVDRINVGGNESGQQSVFRGQGVNDDENDFLVDGVQITDMSAIGASPTYYDFDQFQEVQLSTGGTDVTKNTAGVSVNLVTKRGTNEFRGSARFMLTDGGGYFGALDQADSSVSSRDLGNFNSEQTDFGGNKIDRIEDLGFEAGGPVWKDKLWAWASWAQNDINNITGVTFLADGTSRGGTPDRTILESTSIKLNAQISGSNSAVGSFNNGDKLKFGRGASPEKDASATWNQRGPTGITKFEDTHVFSPNFFASAQYSFVDGGFSLAAQGGVGSSIPALKAVGGEKFIDASGFVTNNASGGNSRPTEEYRAEASYFTSTGNLNHEIKFGFRSREATTSSAWSYPGRNIWHYDGSAAGLDADTLADFGIPASRLPDAGVVYAYRQGPAPVTANYESAWVQDTITSGQWTFNAGVRLDQQDGKNGAASVDANIAFPDRVPALDFPGNNADGISWESLSLRLGATYALGDERKTLLRGSFAQFPDALSLTNISRTNPVSGSGLAMLFLDSPGGQSQFYDDGEDVYELFGFWGFNVNDRTGLSTSNVNDPGMNAPMTNELILGVEHAFLPEFVVGANFTYRLIKDFQDFQRLFLDSNTGEVRTASASEYVSDGFVTGTLPDGSSYSVETFAAPSNLEYAGGTLLTNGDREVESQALSVNFTKRLANRWMARGFFNYNLKEEWSVPSSYFNNNDPNRVQPGFESGSVIDGELFVVQSTGSGKSDNWIQSTWQANLNGLYQVAPDRPWGFNVAANISGREGYPIPYYRTAFGSDGLARNILVSKNIEDFRNDDIFTVDLRLEKEFASSSNTSLTFSLEAFNLLNEAYVLQRYDNLAAGNAQHIGETLSPRVYRLGVRLNWR